MNLNYYFQLGLKDFYLQITSYLKYFYEFLKVFMRINLVKTLLTFRITF